jgi:hypothetical protein
MRFACIRWRIPCLSEVLKEAFRQPGPEKWERIRTAAGLPDVTIHDLRRTCASWLACHGENLAIIGNVLNYSGLQHTAVYARLNISPVTRALEENSARMLPPAVSTIANRPAPRQEGAPGMAGMTPEREHHPRRSMPIIARHEEEP